MTRHDSNYEPPAAEPVPTEYGLAETAAGATQPYTSITLIDDDGKQRSDK
jgi:hypothetical protein